MTGGPAWDRDGRDWPNRAHSSFPFAANMRWHVQRMGRGPVALLLHGTGAATHSWRGLLPILAKDFDSIAPDLPGHGFTATPAADGLSLPGMARRIAALLDALQARPSLIIGHSAGAAIAMRMALDGLARPDGIIAINGAMLPLAGIAGSVFSPLAKLLAGLPLVPWLVALRAEDRAVVERLLRGTGSSIDRAGVEFYTRLFSRRGHVAATLGMMAAWDLGRLERDLPSLELPLAVIIGANDRTVPAAEQRRVVARLRHAECITLPGLGHLAHEEAPDAVASAVSGLGFVRSALVRHAESSLVSEG
ncbi:alpha/beta fold hydrolase BchO [Plastoroseomonas arctica]|uniref:Alpha/beta fold hydrolase n=1 Tax=Plastoroseomonas arctica TaxID=1509237 RepID=A0AAF1JZY4_9PROT|nr:alpha/beta fold hydrolase BchO [Plastoroseomonas arctica]MBR0654489.1 alpha/beta fold hydrolase [Plastoroseomonas arctica]